MTTPETVRAGRAPGRRAPRATARLLGVLAFLAGGAAGLAVGASAQAIPSSGVAVHRYQEPGEPVIAVDVWGAVRQTGRFFIPPDTGLLELLALTGGPPPQTETEEVEREVVLSLSRMAEGQRRVVFQANVDSLSAGAVMPPPLLNEDLITVNTSVERPFSWTDALTIVAGVASLALVLLRVGELSGAF